MNFFRPGKFHILGGALCLFLLLGIAGCQEKEDAQETASILPAPQKVELKGSVSLKPEGIKTIYLYAKAGSDDRFAAHLLQGGIDSLFGRSLNIQEVDSYRGLASPAILLGIPSADRGFSNFSSKLPAPERGTRESYVLDVKKNLITISGGGKAGLFYGVQTLIQLLEDAKWKNISLHGMLVQDWPDLKIRGVHFDEKHHLDRYNYLKKAVAKLAKYKVNEIVFEFENKFRYQSHPDIAAPHAFTPEQVKKLTQYAHKYHIAITPLVQGLGHAGYILKHDKYKSLRENPESNWAFNPLKKGTYDLLFDLYRETIAATPGSKYFHVGGDEVRFSGSNHQMQAYEKKHGTLSLYLTWLDKVHNYLEKQGRTMIFWDDVPLKKAGIYRTTYRKIPLQTFDSVWSNGTAKLNNTIEKFPHDAVFNRWNYGLGRKRGNIHIMDWYNQHGIQVISATAIQNMRPLIPDYEKKPKNIKSFVTLSARKHVLGEVCTAWDASGPHFETFWMGFLASAEYGWSSKSPSSLHQYWDKYLYRFFGPETTGLYQAFHKLSNRVDFWDTALMKKGKKHWVHRKGNQLIELPTFKDRSLNDKSHFRTFVKTGRVEQKKNTGAIKTLEKNVDQVKRNAYNLEVFASMGRFMKAHAGLVVSIGKIAHYRDEALAAYKKDQKNKVLKYLNKMAATADSAWQQYKKSYENLKKVWEVSRYPKGGKGYILNRFADPASQREDLSFLIMAEEQLDLPGYAEKLRHMADQYKEQDDFSFSQSY